MNDFPNLSAAKEFWLDIESKDESLAKEKGAGWARHLAHTVGIALAWDDEPARYFPIAHHGYSNLDRDSVLRWLSTEVLRSGKPIGGHNIGYDLGTLSEDGCPVPHSGIRDSMTAAPLLDEDLDHYSLEYLGQKWLNEGKDEGGLVAFADEHLLDPKGDIWRMPPSLVAPYAEQDVNLTRKLIRYVEGKIHAEDSHDAATGHGSGLSRALDLEYGLIPLTIAMRRRGIRIDVEKLERAKSALRVMRTKALAEIRDRWGVDISTPWSPKAVASLFDQLGIPYLTELDPETGKVTPSFRKPWLQALNHDAGNLILVARAGSKAASTFIDSWLTHLVGDRLHPEWHQTRSDEGGTISFRYSCSNPNLQQVPHRDKAMADVLLPMFLADEGEQLTSLDYHQQEPGLGVHYAHLLDVPGAEKIWQRYQTGRVDFHDIATEMIERLSRASCSKQDFEAARTVYKQINLGMIYGMGRKKLVASTGKTPERAEEILADHKREFAFIHGLARVCSNKAASLGWIRTLMGHKRRFNLWEPDRYTKVKLTPRTRAEAESEWPGQLLRRAYTYTGLNTLIQTSAAGQMKAAMLACWKEGIVPSLQIHDELLISSDERTAKRVEEIMREAVKLTVPVVVDAASGKNWREAS